MTSAEYDALADVYDWLVPETLLEPDGAVAAFESVLERIPSGGRVLDCAAGTGRLAVGLALRGYRVVAVDISPSMVERTATLARDREVHLDARVSSWDAVADLGLEPFDAVFCVGNSLTHAEGVRGRRSALQSMRSALRPGGALAVTSRNWAVTRASGSRLEVGDALIVRNGIAGLVVHSWSIADDWDEPHILDVAVALLDDGRVRPHVARLTFWPFSHGQLLDDLEACSFAPRLDTYEDTLERYLVVSTAASSAGGC